MFECQESQEAGRVLLLGLQTQIQDLTSTMILTLNLDLSEELTFPVVWIIAQFLSSLWQLRVEKKR